MNIKRDIFVSIIISLLISSLSFFLLFGCQQQPEESKPLNVNITDINIKGNKAEIKGEVTDSEGKPIPGVTISFVDKSGIPYSLTTTETGHFRMSLRKEQAPSGIIDLRLVLEGFAVSSYQLDLRSAEADPDLPWPPDEEADTEGAVEEEEQCETREIVLKNAQGLAFSSGDVVEKEAADIYFQDEHLYSRRGKGGISSVGEQGNKSLCDINYPLSGYCDCSLIVKNHVYIYESYHDDIHAEIRVKSFKPGEEVKIVYHLKKE